MQQEHVRVGQRIRVNVPGMGDHGQVGTIKKVRGNKCYVHLDWDERPWHVVMFYPADLELVPDDALPAHQTGWGAGDQALQPRNTNTKASHESNGTPALDPPPASLGAAALLLFMLLQITFGLSSWATAILVLVILPFIRLFVQRTPRAR